MEDGSNSDGLATQENDKYCSSEEDSIYNFDDVERHEGSLGFVNEVPASNGNNRQKNAINAEEDNSKNGHYKMKKKPGYLRKIKSNRFLLGSPNDQEPTSEDSDLIKKRGSRSDSQDSNIEQGEEEGSGRAPSPTSSTTSSSQIIHVQGITNTASHSDPHDEARPDEGDEEQPRVVIIPPEDEEDEGKMEGEEEGVVLNGVGEDTPKRSLLGTQGDVVQMASLITNPGMKRAESMDIIHASLHQLARDGDVETMKRWLATLKGNVRKKVNVHDEMGLSPLHYAARYNHVACVQTLLDYGAVTGDVDAEGGTPLHFAARYKRMRLTAQSPSGDGSGDDGLSQSDDLDPEKSVILYLIKKGANPNAQDIYGCTPLHFAAMRGNEVATKQLLHSGKCYIETIDKQKMTALHLAASHDESEVVRMLIEKGANLQCEDEEKCIPLHFACMEGSLEIVNMILEAAEQKDGWVTVSQMVASQDNQENTPLHLAVENRSLDVANICIEKNADVNMTRSNYMTPLHLAAVSGELEIVKLLVAHNARVDALNIDQQTPLHCAAEYDHVDVVEYLLDKGAKINRHDKDNYSPLLLAAVEGNPSTLGTLLRRGANLYDVDKCDKTALFLSAEQDQIEALRILLSHPKAKRLMDLSDRYDNTPLHVAAQNGFLSIVKELINAGADMEFKNEEDQTPIHVASMNGKTAVVRELVKRNKTVVNHEDEDSNTALHLAALAGHNKVVRELIEAGADIEARNTTLWTPLDCAAAKGWPKVVRTLLEADAPVDPMDKSKTTPLHLACRSGHVPVVTILLEWNANVRQRDADGHNCLDLAIDSGNKDVAMTIVNSSHWREALRNETMDLTTGLRQTPMRKLIRKMPDAAERVFSHCTTSEINNPDHPDYSIKFNYEFLDDMYANWRDEGDSVSVSENVYDEDHHVLAGVNPYSSDTGVLRKNHPLMIMVRANQEDLLAHPLVTSLLRHKWDGFGRYVYYSNLALYCVFLTFLTAYLLASTPPYMYKQRLSELLPNETAGLTECQKVRLVKQFPIHPVVQWLFINIGKYVIIALSAFAILREIFQIFKSRMSYIGWENLIEWLVYIMSVLLVIDFEACQQEIGVRTNWQWQLGAVAIFLAWIDLVLFMRKLPRFGIYVVMFTDILRTFISFFPVFFLFILAFAFSFAVLFRNQFEFASVGRSLIKTSVMMIGEFEFTNLFFEEEEYPGEFSHKVIYQEVSYLIFVAFLIVMSILIMNLLVGLAVDDIKAVQESAVLKRLAMQVELVLEVESVIPQWLRRKLVRRYRVIYPNRNRGCLRRSCPELESSTLSSSAITKALNPELLQDVTGREYELSALPTNAGPAQAHYEMVLAKSETDELEQVQETQEEMKSQLNQLRGRMKSMSQNQETMTNMLTALLKHHNVEWQEEDFQQEDS